MSDEGYQPRIEAHILGCPAMNDDEYSGCRGCAPAPCEQEVNGAGLVVVATFIPPVPDVLSTPVTIDVPPMWITVEERLPEEGVDYLVTARYVDRTGAVTKSVFVADVRYDGDEIVWSFEGCGQVTHWMPLPDPAKGGDPE